MIPQTAFPVPGHNWQPGADFTGYEKPQYDVPNEIHVSIIGSVKNELEAFKRSWEIWCRQRYTTELIKPTYWLLDDGSDDDIGSYANLLRTVGLAGDGPRVVYVRYRNPGGEDRSCTLLFNHAIRYLVTDPYVMIQWWDRIPGSFRHLEKLAIPHLKRTGITTNAVSRHVGGSSSMETMKDGDLRDLLGSVNWVKDPTRLRQVAGKIGGHCVPGKSSESSGMFFRKEEFLAVGGYDERYTQRASYANVELWRRLLQAGVTAYFVPEPDGANYHQSHEAAREHKTMEFLADKHVCRNQGVEWGDLEPLEVWG